MSTDLAYFGVDLVTRLVVLPTTWSIWKILDWLHRLARLLCIVYCV